jgi:CTP synthase
VTDEIQDWIERVSRLPVDGSPGQPDVCIIELGGTVGDIESMPFIEALRQFQFRVGSDNFCLIHVSLVPVVGAVGEQKTKPTQHSVQALRSAGLSPHMLACRSQAPLEQSVMDKLALFCHVTPDCILNLCDVSNIWHVPLVMQEQGGHLAIMRQLKLDFRKLELDSWAYRANKWDTVTEPVKIAIVGKYTGLGDSYLSVTKALMHSAISADRKLDIVWVEAGLLEDNTLADDPPGHAEAWAKVHNVDGILVPGGFGERGTEGKILAAKYARENQVPFLGICLGMQAAVIEYARSVLGMKNAHSTEMVPDCAEPAVIFMPEGSTTHMGGTMRLGSRRTIFQTQDCKAAKLYNSLPFIDERHRHRYEVNPDIVDRLEEAGCVFVGKDETNRRMEILELCDHPFFLATQYHPEYKSRPGRPSPPFMGLVLAASGQLDQYLTSDAISMRVNAPGGFLQSPLKAFKGLTKKE